MIGVTCTTYILLACIIFCCCSRSNCATGEHCLRESFNVTCAADEVLLMTSARYGRMRGGRCINVNYGHIGCSTDVTSQLDEECSGKQLCVFPVASLLEQKPCPDDLTSYLEASYKCVKVSESKCSSDGHILVSERDGYIPLSRHSPRCPWKLTVDPLQKLRFTLFSFGQRKKLEGPCPWSVVFEEGSKEVEENLCQVNSREVQMYSSKANSVTTYVLHRQNVVLPSTYLLKYESVGCPRLKVPASAWVKQDEHRATVKCNQSEETWFLACNGRDWNGEIGNCSKVINNGIPVATDSLSDKFTPLPIGFVLAVVIGVLLGVVIGSIPLALVYICLRRKWRQQQQAAPCYVRDGIYYPELQPNFSDEARSMYPALLKPAPLKTDSYSKSRDYCYNYADPYAGPCTVGHHHVTNCVNGEPVSWEEQTISSIHEGCHAPNCCSNSGASAVLECPDVMLHSSTKTAIVTRNDVAPTKRTIQEHVYESASFGRSGRAGAGLAIDCNRPINETLATCYEIEPGQHRTDDM